VAWLESVPNVSEGRDAERVARLGRALAQPGVAWLDGSSDPDHHRSVFTVAGEPGALERGLVALWAAALAEIDLRRHRGAHPRVGAVDVAPLVPLPGATLADAVACARRVAAELARRFELPVYLYEEAATRADRRRLPDLRRGGFERFGERIGLPGWEPDFGPARVHPTAGVAIVGARFFLVAFNVVLDSDDLALARSIASRLRTSGGGLPALRALGVPLASRGRVQVSMNLLDYRLTSPLAAFEAVERAARELGARVLESEIVGLAPAAAFAGVDESRLRLASPLAGRLLEPALARAGFESPGEPSR
jgi:glutamate formiminotransferase